MNDELKNLLEVLGTQLEKVGENLETRINEVAKANGDKLQGEWSKEKALFNALIGGQIMYTQNLCMISGLYNYLILGPYAADSTTSHALFNKTQEAARGAFLIAAKEIINHYYEDASVEEEEEKGEEEKEDTKPSE